MSEPKTMTFSEAAAALGVSVRTIQRRVSSGDMEPVKDAKGRTVAVRVDRGSVPDPTAGETALVIRDALAGIVDRYRESLDRLDRQRSRWMAAGVAGLSLGVAGVAGMTLMVSVTKSRDRQAEAATSDLVDALHQNAKLREELAKAATLTAAMSEELRHADADLELLELQCLDLTRQRDELKNEVVELTTAIVVGPVAASW